ncbi:unnamed protein product [Rotaria sp. Silwood2]|nr:unnamed protein product [Rotaria sp. Silwood2]CAF4486465.1 unnamed protein product [Rotaria sp. Silwood2]
MFKGDRYIAPELFDAMGTSTIIRECSDIDQLYDYMIKLFPSDKLIEFSYLKGMGAKNFTKKNFVASLDFFKRSLGLRQKFFSSNDREIAELHGSIAESYYRLTNYNEAIDFYHKALDFNSLPTPKTIMAHFYLGFSYLIRANWNNFDDLSSAKYHPQTALDINLEYEMLRDEMITDIYQALTDVNEYQHELDSAMDGHIEAVEICERKSNLSYQLETSQHKFLMKNTRRCENDSD